MKVLSLIVACSLTERAQPDALKSVLMGSIPIRELRKESGDNSRQNESQSNSPFPGALIGRVAQPGLCHPPSDRSLSPFRLAFGEV